jgi:hypothetical protein
VRCSGYLLEEGSAAWMRRRHGYAADPDLPS